MLPDTPVELTIDRLGQLGEGVGSYEGRTVFVPGTFPGERVRVRLEQEGKVVRGHLLGDVLAPSPDRRRSPCGLSARCGGCDWLELSESAQRAAKQEIVLSALEHLGRLKRDGFAVRPLLMAPTDFGYRRRAVLHFLKEDLTYFGRRSHDRVPVDECGALVPALAGLPGKLGPLLKPVSRDAEEVHLLAEGGKAAFAVMLKGQATPRHVEACDKAVRALRLEGALLVPKEGSPRIIGKPVLRSLSPLRPEVPLYLRPDAFSQAHAEANVGLVTSAVYELARVSRMRYWSCTRATATSRSRWRRARHRCWGWSPLRPRWSWRRGARGRVGWPMCGSTRGMPGRCARASSARGSGSTSRWRTLRGRGRQGSPGGSRHWE